MYMGWNRIEYDAMGWNWIDGIGLMELDLCGFIDIKPPLHIKHYKTMYTRISSTINHRDMAGFLGRWEDPKIVSR